MGSPDSAARVSLILVTDKQAYHHYGVGGIKGTPVLQGSSSHITRPSNPSITALEGPFQRRTHRTYRKTRSHHEYNSPSPLAFSNPEHTIQSCPRDD